MSIRRTEFEGVEGICLENDSISLVVCPSVGGKIVSFCLKDTGQELLWRNEKLALRPYPEGTAYDPHFYGGIDELLPMMKKKSSMVSSILTTVNFGQRRLIACPDRIPSCFQPRFLHPVCVMRKR